MSDNPNKHKVDVKIKSIDPFIVEKDEKECMICRRPLNEVCYFCQSGNITDTSQCPISRGKCGHIFHSHYIDQYLKCNNNNCVCGKTWEKL